MEELLSFWPLSPIQPPLALRSCLPSSHFPPLPAPHIGAPRRENMSSGCQFLMMNRYPFSTVNMAAWQIVRCKSGPNSDLSRSNLPQLSPQLVDAIMKGQRTDQNHGHIIKCQHIQKPSQGWSTLLLLQQNPNIQRISQK